MAKKSKKRTRKPAAVEESAAPAPAGGITDDARLQFRALKAGDAHYALAPVVFDGQPTSAICYVQVEDEDERTAVYPVFVALTEAMIDKLRNEKGDAPK